MTIFAVHVHVDDVALRGFKQGGDGRATAFFAAEDAFRKHLFRKFKDHERPGKPGKPDPRRAEPTRRPDREKTSK